MGEEKKGNTIITVVALILLLVTIGAWGYWWYYIHNISSDCWAQRGQFGDSFGVITSLFAGLAFWGVILTLMLQKRELDLTKQELKGTKEVLTKQNFENTFFQLLSLQNEIVKTLSYKLNERTIEGRACFHHYYENIKQKYSGKTNLLFDEFFDEIWNSFSSENINNIDHYFRNLHKLLDIIDKSNNIVKTTYTEIIRAQLSGYELIMIFYYGIRPLGGRGFKKLLEKYIIFEDMNFDLIIHNVHFTLYSYDAFGEQSNNVRLEAEMQRDMEATLNEAIDKFLKKRKKPENPQSNGDKDISDAP